MEFTPVKYFTGFGWDVGLIWRLHWCSRLRQKTGLILPSSGATHCENYRHCVNWGRGNVRSALLVVVQSDLAVFDASALTA